MVATHNEEESGVKIIYIYIKKKKTLIVELFLVTIIYNSTDINIAFSIDIQNMQ